MSYRGRTAEEWADIAEERSTTNERLREEFDNLKTKYQQALDAKHCAHSDRSSELERIAKNLISALQWALYHCENLMALAERHDADKALLQKAKVTLESAQRKV